MIDDAFEIGYLWKKINSKGNLIQPPVEKTKFGEDFHLNYSCGGLFDDEMEALKRFDRFISDVEPEGTDSYALIKVFKLKPKHMR